MINLNDAEEYLSRHYFNEKWMVLEDLKKESVLNLAEIILHSHYNFRENAFLTDSYFYAVCEQAIHLLNFAPERYQLQQEGVTYYAVDGITFTMGNNLISPVAKGFLNKITMRRIGDAK